MRSIQPDPTRVCGFRILVVLFGALGAVHAQVSWDGGANDGLWTSAQNWSGDVVPTSGDTVLISNGDTVDLAGLSNGNLPNGITITVDGGSALTQSSGAARLAGATLHLASGGNLTGGFWDLNNGTVHIADGASITTGNWEHKGSNMFRYEFSALGFATLSPGRLRSGNSATWADVTYEIDVTNYSLSNGTSVVLADYNGHDTAYDGVFNPTVNIIGGTASLSFDTAQSQLIVSVEAPPITWDGGGTGDSWATAANWNPDGVPGATDDVVVGAGASVTDAPNSFGSLAIEAGATVTFPGQFLDGTKTLAVAGTLDGAGVLRFGATMDLSGALGAGITFLDTNNGTINFVDGASFTNAGMSFEHKGTNTFGYRLSTTGFSTISAGQLFSGAGAVWSDVTYEIDISEYDHANGTTIVLADYTGHAVAYDGTFDPTVNVIAGDSGLGGVLSFETATSQLVLSIDPPGNDAPVADDVQVALKGSGPVGVVLSGMDVEGSPLSYLVTSGPASGTLSGTEPNLTYTPGGASFQTDTFTYTVSDGELTSDPATVTIVSVPDTAAGLWAGLQAAIESDALNVQTLSTWTEDGITISQVLYDLGTLVGTRTTASPRIAAYYAVPTGGTNLPGLVQIHGGGQRANASLAKYWAEQGYAAISINWGGLELQPGLANTDWDGLAAGFTRPGITEAIHHNWADPDTYSDGQTLHDVPHPLNSSWILNAYAARRALTFLQNQGEVDGTKLGVAGWSMGGRTTVLTSTDPRITAVSPGVGGSGFLYEDWWGLPGTARRSNGVEDPDLYHATVAAQAYWPDITAATLFYEASNDFNAPFDLVTQAMALQNPAVEQRMAIAPHYNHRTTSDSLAARTLWMKTHLAGTFDFPETSTAELDLTTVDGTPVFKVWPDTSTTHPVVGVDIYYGIERNSLNRFWRDAGAVDMGTHWEAPCPIADTDEMVVAFALVRYDMGFTLELTPGSSPTNVFSVASEIATVRPPELANHGVKETAVRTRLIDDFSRGYKDWFRLNATNGQLWQHWTRKINDWSWEGPVGGSLAFGIESGAPGNALGIKLLTDWNENPDTTYVATVPVPAAGVTNVSLPVASFTNVATGEPLASWDRIVIMGMMPATYLDAAEPAWAGGVPTFSNLRWEGGEWTFLNGVTSDWLEQFGLPLNDATVLLDTDLDGLANWGEFLAGTIPTDATSRFRLTGTQVSESELHLKWPTVAGRIYELWASPDLTEGSWELEEGNLAYTVPLGSTTVSIGPGQRFFQIGVR